jgi:DNA polymerase III epsilon subunit-like protein
MKIKSQDLPKYALSLDWETSGYSSPNYADKHQGISFGAVVFNARTFEIVDTLYQEIKFDATKYEWSDGAEKIHGLSREHLEKNGVSQEEAAVALGEMLLKWFGPDEQILILAHNPNFDKAFAKQLFDAVGLPVKIWFRAIDTCAIAAVTFGVLKSDALYDAVGLPPRTAHNALEDAIYSVEACRAVKEIFNAGLQAIFMEG